MVTEIKAYIASEMVVLKTDLSTLAGRIQSTKKNVRSLKQDTTTAQLHEVSLTCAELTAEMGQQEDMARQCNLTIWGIPNAIDAGELPQFIMKLISTTLTPKQAKGTLLDGIYRLTGNLTNKPSGSRDVIVCFRSWTDKDSFMAQVRGQSPFIFEQHSLCFFQDLSRSTLQWRATLKEVTSQLRTVDIPYRWGTPQALVAERNGKRHRLTSVFNTDSFLQSLGQTTTTTSRPNRPTHEWDVDNVGVFTPASSTAPG
ncbi:Hypothetical predicted protein [Pelobates cultripes]|uniref:Uncharacterized protein n=1 Tax=Pelobates cultripes TaxID=61616 RepID=A0AAD1T5G6_PELCU|nr:Hypothetical predicted protein [Pelobates cultripes]CAH2319483.1 Hypothetical predicted protein [Pelobates cultripes]